MPSEDEMKSREKEVLLANLARPLSTLESYIENNKELDIARIEQSRDEFYRLLNRYNTTPRQPNGILKESEISGLDFFSHTDWSKKPALAEIRYYISRLSLE